MNRLLLLALTAGLISSCGYRSRYEADKACKEWSAKGGTFTETWSVKKTSTMGIVNGYWGTVEPYELEVNRSQERAIRGCKKEEETKQVMGMKRKGIKKGVPYTRPELKEKRKDWEVVKRFKY